MEDPCFIVWFTNIEHDFFEGERIYSQWVIFSMFCLPHGRFWRSETRPRMGTEILMWQQIQTESNGRCSTTGGDVNRYIHGTSVSVLSDLLDPKMHF